MGLRHPEQPSLAPRAWHHEPRKQGRSALVLFDWREASPVRVGRKGKQPAESLELRGRTFRRTR
jgi:hypothetical protein